MNLAIDIGNSLAKLAVIENGQVVDFLKTDRPDAAFVAGVLDANPPRRSDRTGSRPPWAHGPSIPDGIS